MTLNARKHLKAMVFVDAENHPDLDVTFLMRRLSKFDVVERHAYADWRNRCLDRLAERLEREGFDMHHTWSGHRPGAQKDKADGCMRQDIVRLLARRPEVDVVVLVSGDTFFTDIVLWLQERGKRVIVASAPLRTNKELPNLADGYLLLGKLERSIQKLHDLERVSGYVTFGFAVQKLGIAPSDLAELIRRNVVIQREVSRSGRGTRPEICLNRRDYAVQAVLGMAA